MSRFVTVRVADVDLPAVVEQEQDGALELSLAVAAPAGFAGALDAPVVVEAVVGRGLRCITGRAAWDAGEPDRLRVRRDSEALVQRRRAGRVDVTVPALLVVIDGGAGRAATTTVNVSATGLLVRDPLGLAPGAVLRVDLELDAGGPPVRVDGTVVRADGRGQVAVLFEPVSREDRDRLARFISDANRVERRTRRAR